MTNNHTIIIRNQRLFAKKIGKEFILLDVNSERLYKLNSTAETVWKYLWKGRARKEIVSRITEEFSVDRKQVENEVTSFIGKHLSKLFFIISK